MNKRDTAQRRTTEKWLKRNGINVAHIYVGTTELFQASKLATTTLREHGRLLGNNEANTLNNFLQATRSAQKRNKITQGQCFNVMNIAKKAQRLCAKHKKAKR